MPVDGLSDLAAGVTDKASDLLYSHLAVRHQADESVPQLPRSPVSSDTGCSADRPELTPHTASIQRTPRSGTEYKVAGIWLRACMQRLQRHDRQLRQRKSPA
jgi:hypothetical protein